MRKLILFLMVVIPLLGYGQQPQAQVQALQGINSKWTNGVAPGYYPTCSPSTCVGLTLSVGPGTCFDATGTRQTYAGSTLTMTNSTTNYVYLAESNCGLTQNTTGYPKTGAIPIATVVASGGNITSITDNRTFDRAVGNPRRVCAIIIGADNAATALVNGDIAPQGRQCLVPYNATVIEVDVAADGGTPSVVVDNNHAGSTSNLLSSALATASSGGIACSNTGGTTGIDGVTTCSATLQNTSILAGDYLETITATAGGAAKRMSIFIIFISI